MEVWQMFVLGSLFLILAIFSLIKTIQSFRTKKKVFKKIVLVISTLICGFLAFCFLFAGAISGVFYTFFSEVFGGIFSVDYWNGK